MSITQRRYRTLVDFEKVYRFLQETYDRETLNSYLLPQYFEYAHMHTYFDYFKTHHIGIWEEQGDIVGIACFEMRMGDCHLHVKETYEPLLPELLIWAEQELSIAKDGKYCLKVWITDAEPGKRELLHTNGYSLEHTEPVKIFDYKKPFAGRKLPDGFTLIDGTNVDFLKLEHCFYKGFDHGENPDGDGDGSAFSCNAPRSDMSLMTIAVAPDGEYACALGMWFDERNKYAYLEPFVLHMIDQIVRFAKDFEDEFVKIVVNEKYKMIKLGQEKNKRDLAKLKARNVELENILSNLYEDKVKGVLSEDLFSRLSKKYETEGQEVQEQVEQLQKIVDEDTQHEVNVDGFLKLVRKYTRINELTPEIIQSFIDRIVVSHKQETIHGMTQKIEVYFNMVGKVTLPTIDEKKQYIKSFGRKKEKQTA